MQCSKSFSEAMRRKNDERDGVLVVLAGSDGPFGLEIEDAKIVAMNSGCGPESPNS
jgi:hypothetical protein